MDLLVVIDMQNDFISGSLKGKKTEKLLDNENFKGAVDAICPMKRIGNPGELNSTLLYFASKHSSYTTGQLITVDGGWTTV